MVICPNPTPNRNCVRVSAPYCNPRAGAMKRCGARPLSKPSNKPWPSGPPCSESITDAFYALDREYRFTYVNQRALDHFGATRETLLGQVIWDAFPVARGSLFQQEYERALREQRSVAFETVSLLSNRWIEVRAYPTRQGLTVYFRDVTDRKQAEEQLREADERKNEFLAILAHELRNPLAPLRNGLHILKRQSERWVRRFHKQSA